MKKIFFAIFSLVFGIGLLPVKGFALSGPPPPSPPGYGIQVRVFRPFISGNVVAQPNLQAANTALAQNICGSESDECLSSGEANLVCAEERVECLEERLGCLSCEVKAAAFVDTLKDDCASLSGDRQMICIIISRDMRDDFLEECRNQVNTCR